MQLSPHFSLEEFTITQVRHADNVPSPVIRVNLERTARQMEAVRSLLGCPVVISSGFRNTIVNTAVGGTLNSAHLYGYAADFIAPGFGDPLAICNKIAGSDIKFDQLIEEGTWVHLSFDPRMRQQILTKGPNDSYIAGLPANGVKNGLG